MGIPAMIVGRRHRISGIPGPRWLIRLSRLRLGGRRGLFLA